MKSQEAVVIDYKYLLLDPHHDSSHHLLHPLFDQAFGSTNEIHHAPLGLIAIKNIPNFYQTKMEFLPQAHSLISLPPAYLEEKLTDASSLYNAGWSHGKEKLGDKPDIAKGSFYFNPITDTPGSVEDRQRYPYSYPCNIWPDEHLLPYFRETANRLGSIMKQVVSLLAQHIDSYSSRMLGCNLDMGRHMQETEKVKGRLLYYFPIDMKSTNDESSVDSWIGWHNDSGFLTALAGDMYIDHDSGQQISSDQVDPDAGLYVMNRIGEIIHVQIPNDCMAVQIGECMQIITGGCVVATPHCVRGAMSSSLEPSRRIARISFPCFVDVAPSFHLNAPLFSNTDMVLKRSVKSKGVNIPPLEERWINGMDFGTFLQKTFKLYYSWNKKE